jgi:hypothetical protein
MQQDVRDDAGGDRDEDEAAVLVAYPAMDARRADQR